MSIGSLLFPNFDFSLIYAIGFALIGVILLVISNRLPIPFLNKGLETAGWLTILFAIGYWIVESFFKDVLTLMKDNAGIFIGIAVVTIAGLLIFKDDIVPQKKRTNRRK